MGLGQIIMKPFIWGAAMGGRAALYGARAVYRSTLGKKAAQYGGSTFDALMETAAGVAGTTARGVGGFASGAIEAAGGYLDTAVAAARTFAVRPADNLIGWRVTKRGGVTLFAGFAGLGAAGGYRQASVGLVDYGEMTALTGAPMTPNLVGQEMRPNLVDNLGADGELALALHRLSRG